MDDTKHDPNKKEPAVIGPGTVHYLKPDPSVYLYLVKQLMSIPNAFDPVTGKLNRENDKAVILHSMVQLGLYALEYPVLWKEDK